MVEAKMIEANQKAIFTKMLACKVEGWFLAIEQEFQCMKRLRDDAVDDVEHSSKKLEEVRK